MRKDELLQRLHEAAAQRHGAARTPHAMQQNGRYADNVDQEIHGECEFLAVDKQGNVGRAVFEPQVDERGHY